MERHRPLIRMSNNSIERSRQTPRPGAFVDFLLRPASATGGVDRVVPEFVGTSEWKERLIHEQETGSWRFWSLGEFGYGALRQAQALASFAEDVTMGTMDGVRLNGHFVALAFDATAARWHVWTSRLGTCHVYHLAGAHGNALGSRFSSVADCGSQKRLNWPALTSFFTCGFFPATLTHYGDVEVLSPARHVVFDAELNRIESRRYWNWSHSPDAQRSFDETVDAFGRVFGDVMREQIADGAIALPVSGGLDSRSTIVPVLKSDADARNRLWAYSYGYSDRSIETAISRELAAVRGLNFQSFTIGAGLFSQVDAILDATEGFQDVTQCRQAAVTDELAAHADHVIAAHWGDVWCDQMGLADQTGADDEAVLDQATKKMFKRGRQWLLEHLCRRQSSDHSEEAVRDLVRTEMRPYGHIEDRDFRLKAFKTDFWSFRWTLSSIRMFQSAVFPRLPFYDSRIVDFFSTVPTAHVRERRIQVEYIKRFAPDLARVKWQAFDANLYWYPYFNSLLLPKRAWKKLRRDARENVEPKRNWEVQFGGVEGRAQLEAALLGSGRAVHEFVEPAAIRGLLEDFYRDWPDAELGYAVCMLFTFSAWLERHV